MQNLPTIVAAFASALLLSAAHASIAGEPVSFSFDLSTSGEDVFFSAPEAVDPDADFYEFEFEITSITVDAQVGFITLNDIDVTDQVDPRLLMNSGVIEGPAPQTLLDGEFLFPPPPDEASLGASLNLLLDEDGVGQLSATDITLGDVTFDLGPPFGKQTATIVGIGVAGEVTITPFTFPSPDINGDGMVDGADLGILLSDFGTSAQQSDLNCDGLVDGADLGILLSAWTG